MWRKGQPFLVRLEDEWPNVPINGISVGTVPEEALKELRKGNSSEVVSALNVTVVRLKLSSLTGSAASANLSE